ncbi:DUF551 domain-containing protein [Phytobacter diazotrophicus]|uniref:DUF551 domain-containing protein n=1 Tax=Phytobacter diazotrophicus TaxID=395631 RepID=UPI0030762A27
MKDEALLPDVDSLEKVLEWIAGLPVPTKSATANYCRLKNFITDYRAALQSGNSGQVPAGYALVPVEPTPEILDEFDSIIDYGAEDSKDAWSRLIAAAPKISDGWIPVSERLPEVGSTIMVHMDNPQYSATDYAIATYDKYGFSRAKVTHWQPLPDAPKGV